MVLFSYIECSFFLLQNAINTSYKLYYDYWDLITFSGQALRSGTHPNMKINLIYDNKFFYVSKGLIFHSYIFSLIYSLLKKENVVFPNI